MPKPSASSPPHRSRHGMQNTSALAYRRGNESSSGTRPRNRTRDAIAAAFGARGEALPVAAAPRDRELHVGQPGDRVDEHVEALAGHQPADPEHERPLGIEAERATGRGPRRRVEWTEALDVDARRHHDAAAGRARRRALASRAGYRPAATTPAAPRSTFPPSCRLPGNRPGTVTSAPCTTTT